MQLDLTIGTIFFDSCAFDPKYSPEDKAAEAIFRRYDNQEDIDIEIAHSTQKEIDHPNTPDWVKKRAGDLIYTLETSLTDREITLLKNIEKVLAGNGRIENIKQDARHIFEAQKYAGPGYFVTTDARILKKKKELQVICPIEIAKPSEVLVRFRL